MARSIAAGQAVHAASPHVAQNPCHCLCPCGLRVAQYGHGGPRARRTRSLKLWNGSHGAWRRSRGGRTLGWQAPSPTCQSAPQPAPPRSTAPCRQSSSPWSPSRPRICDRGSQGACAVAGQRACGGPRGRRRQRPGASACCRGPGERSTEHLGPVITRLRVPCCPERPSRRPHAHSCSAGLSPRLPTGRAFFSGVCRQLVLERAVGCQRATGRPVSDLRR